MMRYSDWQQRQMDIKSGEELDRHARRRAAQPCKDKQPEVAQDGSCLRCGASQGEACHDRPAHTEAAGQSEE